MFDNDNYAGDTLAQRSRPMQSSKLMATTNINLSSFIRAVADLLRGNFKQFEYGKIILPFPVLRRLDCVLKSTKALVLVKKAKREQAGFLETAKIDTLVTEAPRAIVLLQERCSALISTAVTGQIDVREFA